MALKKITDAPVALKRAEVEKELAMMSVVRQCGLLELSRSTFYYRPVGEDAYNLMLMRLIDEKFIKRPFYGVPRMTASLRVMGLEAIYPRPRLSANGPDHKVYPYILKEVTVDRPDQAWATDITYVRLAHGFVHLIAILDWYSRYVVSRRGIITPFFKKGVINMHQERVLFLPAISSEGERMVKADLWHEIHSRFKLKESKKSIA